MSLHSHCGIYTPHDLRLIRNVFDSIKAEGLLPSCMDERDNFGRFMLKTYGRGMRAEELLLDLCRMTARTRYSFTMPEHASAA